MNVDTVLQRASELGISLTTDGDRLGYTPKDMTPPEFVEVLRDRKLEILEHLRYSETPTDEDLPGVWIEAKEALGITCPVCGANNWWLRTRGGKAWVCGTCHPEPAGA